MEEKIWQNYSLILKELLGLEYSPVAIALLKEPILSGVEEKKNRICRAISDAGKGKVLQIDKKNNACFGAGWHLGFHKPKDEQVFAMIKKFVVEGEKLFASYEALDKLIAQMGEVPDNKDAYFILSPLEKAEFKPGVVIFICNAEQACRLLTLAIFSDGIMPKIKLGGPTCRMAIIYPLLFGEVNISFYDYTSRKMCAVEKDKLLVSIPYHKISGLIDSIERCSAGKAKIEFPQEFREFLQQRLCHTDVSLKEN